MVVSCATRKYFVNIPRKYNHYNQFKPILYDCVDCKDKYMDFIKGYIENDRVVFQPFPDKVIKNKKYIAETHNTLIKFGYKKIMPVEFYSKHVKVFIDSLFYWKENNSDTLNYYYKFWQRRNYTREHTIATPKLRQRRGWHGRSACSSRLIEK